MDQFFPNRLKPSYGIISNFRSLQESPAESTIDNNPFKNMWAGSAYSYSKPDGENDSFITLRRYTKFENPWDGISGRDQSSASNSSKFDIESIAMLNSEGIPI